VEDRRKDVPHQKAAIALPWSDWEMIWIQASVAYISSLYQQIDI